MSFIHDMRDAMFDKGFSYGGEINSYPGKYYSFTSENGSCKRKCCRYRVFAYELGAHFICWRRNLFIIWFAKKTKSFTSNEIRILEDEREEIRNLQKINHAKATSKCINFLKKIIKHINKANQHAYVKRKRILPFFAFGWHNLLIIPVLNINYEIQSIQFIYSNGFKHGKTGAPLSEGMIWLSKQLPNDYSGIIYICEGWATGCIIKEILRAPVICALNCHNLIKVTQALRNKYVSAQLRICADNDHARQDNPGLICARKASLLTGASITYPVTSNAKITDFNDLFIKFGRDEAHRQLILIRE